MRPNSSGVFSSPRARTVNSRRRDSMRPAGTSTLRLRIADSMSWTVRPRAASSEGEIQMRMDGRRSPWICAWATPSIACSRVLTTRSAITDSWIRS